MRLLTFALLASFIFIDTHVLSLNFDQEAVAEENKINSPVLLIKEKMKEEKLKKKLEIWAKNNKGVKGTIPTPRSTIGDVLRVNSWPKTFKNKKYAPSRKPGSNVKLERAVAFYDPLQNVEGVQARINLWNPSVDREKAYSSSQIWISSIENGVRNMIEVGWHVFPRYYHDNYTRFFVHWTVKDGDRELGCYNLDCDGFEQHQGVDKIGKPFREVSRHDGTQHYITVQVAKHVIRGDWTLLLDNRPVGYWKSNIFTHLLHGATSVHWGGEVWTMTASNEEEGGQYILAEMGSGRFAQEGYRRASYFDQLAVAFQNTSFRPITPDDLELTYTHRCYNMSAQHGIGGETNNFGFFYGGPGVGSSCTA